MDKNKHIWRDCIDEFDLRFLDALSLHLNKVPYETLNTGDKEQIEDIYAVIVYMGQKLQTTTKT